VVSGVKFWTELSARWTGVKSCKRRRGELEICHERALVYRTSVSAWVRDSNLLSGSARYRDAGRRDPGGRRNQGEHGAKLAAILVGIRSAREAG
jgi:hypothetical protein